MAHQKISRGLCINLSLTAPARQERDTGYTAFEFPWRGGKIALPLYAYLNTRIGNRLLGIGAV